MLALLEMKGIPLDFKTENISTINNEYKIQQTYTTHNFSGTIENISSLHFSETSTPNHVSTLCSTM